MGSYRRAKLAFDSFRSDASKIIPESPVQESSSRFSQNGFLYSSSIPAKFFGFSMNSSSVSQRVGFGFQPSLNTMNRTRYNPFVSTSGGAKRFYCVDPYHVQQFKPRGPRRWFENLRKVIIVVSVGSGVFITVYFGNLETVPYTKRKHFVLLSKSKERQLGESEFQKMKATFEGQILPAIHPESVRVRSIAKDLIEAWQKGLRQEHVRSDPGYASAEISMLHNKHANATWKALSEVENKIQTKDDDILDDKWVQQARKKGQERGSEAETSHLDGLNWEVLVVDEPVVNAFCLPGGKIVVFTGLLEHFRSEAEIATILGHEVGHVVARHVAEGVTKNLWFAILQLILYQFMIPHVVVNAMSDLFLRLPFSRKMEIEADYIGLLMASAGYDPRVAPKVYEKLRKVSGNSTLRNYLSTHPSGKKRARLLARAQVMEEALTIYRERMSGRGIECFLH